MNDNAEKNIRNNGLYKMFTDVPHRYDMINRMLTLGMDRRWRLKAAKECLGSHPEKVLDICCGTGDLAISIARMADDDVKVSGIDFSRPMLDLAEKKAERLCGGRKVSLFRGDAANIFFEDEYFDCVGISFAFRNLTYKNPMAERYMAEVLRILKPGGRFIIVESSQPQTKLMKKFFQIFLRWYIPMLVYLIRGNKSAYTYLAESAACFYTAEQVQEFLLTAGFRKVSFRRFFFGAAAIHVAVK